MLTAAFVLPAPNDGHDSTSPVLTALAGNGGANAWMTGLTPVVALAGTATMNVRVLAVPLNVQATTEAPVAPAPVMAIVDT
jgi:hypothetical protein